VGLGTAAGWVISPASVTTSCPLHAQLLGSTRDNAQQVAARGLLRFPPGWQMKILLAVDESKFSEAAARALLTLALPAGTAVRVLHVSEPLRVQEGIAMTGFSGVNVESIRKTEWESAHALVTKFADRLRDKGFKTSASVVRGEPRSKIVDVASKWKADLIVVGSHGRTGLKRLLMGSVAEAVVRHAPCSVHVVRISSAA
jgi:nucleotide-binding universal stress UspA family protein